MTLKTISQGKTMLPKLSLITASFYEDLALEMEAAAEEEADKLGFSVEKKRVAGVYDMPLVLKKQLAGDSAGAVLVGIVIKGKTDHDKIVAENTARKAVDLSLVFNKPVGLGIVGPGVSMEDAVNRHKEYAKRAVLAVKKSLEALK